MNWNEFSNADLGTLDVEQWLDELPVEEDPCKRSGEVIALAYFAKWERETTTGVTDEEREREYARTYLSRITGIWPDSVKEKGRKRTATV
jgi:hypothetical protein